MVFSRGLLQVWLSLKILHSRVLALLVVTAAFLAPWRHSYHKSCTGVLVQHLSATCTCCDATITQYQHTGATYFSQYTHGYTDSHRQSQTVSHRYAYLLTSELRIPLYSILRTHGPIPNDHIAQLTNSIIRSRPRPKYDPKCQCFSSTCIIRKMVDSHVHQNAPDIFISLTGLVWAEN